MKLHSIIFWLLRELARDLRDLLRYGFSPIPPTTHTKEPND